MPAKSWIGRATFPGDGSPHSADVKPLAQIIHVVREPAIHSVPTDNPANSVDALGITQGRAADLGTCTGYHIAANQRTATLVHRANRVLLRGVFTRVLMRKALNTPSAAGRSSAAGSPSASPITPLETLPT